MNAKFISNMDLKAVLLRWLPLILLMLGLSVEIFYAHASINGIHISPGTIIKPLFDAFIVTFIYALFPINRGKWIGVPFILTAIYTIGNLLYDRYIGGYMPLNAWLEFDNLNGLGDSILYGLNITDYAIIVFVLTLTFLSAKYSSNELKYKEAYCVFFSIMPVLLFCYLYVTSYISDLKNNTTKGWDTGYGLLYYNQDKYIYDRSFVVSTIAELTFYNNSKHKVLAESEKKQIKNFINNKNNLQIQYNTIQYNTIQYNTILFLIVESLNSKPIGEKIDNVEVTPNLNRLASNGIFCNNMNTDVNKGQSSDGQFIYFTGLKPSSKCITVIDYMTNTFYGLGKMANETGYEPVFINCLGKNFWRQEQACSAYGIKHHYASNDYEAIMGKEYKATDENIFNYTYELLKKYRSRPTFFTALTITMHGPQNKPFEDAIEHFDSVENQEYRCYLQKLNYMDAHLGKFLDKLEKDSILDDMLIVVASDHTAPYNFCENERDKIPLIIYGKGIEPREINIPLRQIDVYPTILNLMGYSNLPYMGLGHSVFDLEKGVDRPENYIEEAQKISDLILEGDYFKQINASCP